jgi:hypothetical protein
MFDRNWMGNASISDAILKNAPSGLREDLTHDTLLQATNYLIGLYEYANRCVLFDMIARFRHVEDKKADEAFKLGHRYKSKTQDDLARWMVESAMKRGLGIDPHDQEWATAGDEWGIVPVEFSVKSVIDDGGQRKIIFSGKPVRIANPAGLTPKGERMYQHIKAGYKGDPRAAEIASRTVIARSRDVPGLRRNPSLENVERIVPLAEIYGFSTTHRSSSSRSKKR